MQNSIFIYILLYLDYYYNRIINLLCNKRYLHSTIFELLLEKILRIVPEQSEKHIEKQLKILNDNLFDYICYWNKMYYRNGLCDGAELISSSFE